MPPMLTPHLLRAMRGIKGWSQVELADRAKVTANSIAAFETGKRDLRVETADKLLRAMGVEITYRVDGTVISGP